MELLKQMVRSYADAHADQDGWAPTALAGVGVFRAYAPTGQMHVLYQPVICLVLAGAKHLATGSEAQVVAAGQSLIVRADVPVVSRVVEASRADPYLAFALTLDMGLVREIALQIPQSPPGPTAPAAPRVLLGAQTDAAVLEAAVRLMRLLDRPEAVPVLAPSIVRELHYWLLTGPHGATLRALAARDSHAERIARAVAVLRAEFDRPLPVERLAATAGMSLSSFHQHFKAITSLAPRQFQKQLRLQEARRLMRAEGASATGAAFAVGYASVSQFTREYARMFGAPPGRDRHEAQAAA